jgi:hypothetical protein
MFARFSGFGPGHKYTHHITKVFRDEIREVFGVGHSKDEGIDHEDDLEQDSEDGREYEEESDDGDIDYSDENGEDLGDCEDDLGYAPL